MRTKQQQKQLQKKEEIIKTETGQKSASERKIIAEKNMAQIIYASLNMRTRSFHFPHFHCILLHLFSSLSLSRSLQQRKMRIHIRISIWRKKRRNVRVIVINTWKPKI